jgi:uncharacterized DUF497 family protein
VSVVYILHVEQLIWSKLNIAHIARPEITPSEVEEACFGEHIATDTYNHRVLLIGITQAGRAITVVLHPQENHAYFPVTARPTSRKERKLYEMHKREEVA